MKSARADATGSPQFFDTQADRGRMEFTPLHRQFVAEVRGIDLRDPLAFSERFGSLGRTAISERKDDTPRLRDPTEHATQWQFAYAHRWQAGGLVMWDNRSLMHRACDYDMTQRRDVRRTTVMQERSTMEEAGPT